MASTFEQMRANVGKLLRGIDRYNPENLSTLERYVETQARENAYDLEANLAVLKLHSHTALPHCLRSPPDTLQCLRVSPFTPDTLQCLRVTPFTQYDVSPVFVRQQASLEENRELIDGITGFEDSVRKFICHVVGITYQNIDKRLLAEMLGDPLDTQVKAWMSKYGWTENESGQVFIYNQEESIKPKNIVEKIDFESVSSIMATSQ
uniref:Eukaryotic translation initiation factor 3 subunit K n=1 Tax=Lepisosteus oculatus TaxID=7918 RepID=W5NAJ5_LEPOC